MGGSIQVLGIWRALGWRKGYVLGFRLSLKKEHLFLGGGESIADRLTCLGG